MGQLFLFRTLFGVLKSGRIFLFGVCFGCLLLTQSQLKNRKLSEVPATINYDTLEKQLSNRVQSDSGAYEIECVSRLPPSSGYNYSFKAPQINIPNRQWCCVSPNMRDIIKVKQAKRSKDGSTEELSTLVVGVSQPSIRDENSTVITGADGSEWRIPSKSHWTWKCLPQFIIAGTQKSGSTALAAYLLAHPQVSLGRSKEVHFFDKPISLGLLPYLINFASVDSSGGFGVVDTQAVSEIKAVAHPESLPFAPPFINGEATPFYIADRHACRDIKKHMPESPAMIVLLRSPVDRAYSEYMMKKRRVESQDEFLDILDRTAYALLQCLSKSLNVPMGSYSNRSLSSLSGRSSTSRMSVESCAPSELTAHAKWKDLKKALRALTSPESSKAKSSNTAALETAKHPLDNVLPCFYTTTPWMSPPPRKPLPPSLPLGTFSTHNSSKTSNSTTGRLNRFYITRSALQDSFFIVAANMKRSSPYVHFDVERCVPRGLGERFPSTAIFRKEMDEFNTCAGVNALDSLESLDAAVSKCVKVHHGISSQFIYRSMYAVQLYHCYKSIPKENFLILDSNLLKQKPHQALRLVHSHLGVADFDYSEVLDGSSNPAEKLQAVFDTYYPSFEERTGWRMDGEYEPISEELKKSIELFFKPHNVLLEELTNQTFSWS